ncbi:hypothetical protein CL633_04130 [bacterium]|nr:hypothetical protein [bacterium]
MKTPVLKSNQVVKKLKRAGFCKYHQKGSHLVMKHESDKRMCVVPIHQGKDIPRPTLKNIIAKQAKLSIKEFINL